MPSIKLATQQDLVPLARVYVSSLDAAQTDERWTEDSALALLTDWFRRQPDLFFAAEMDNKFVGGFVVAVRPWWDGNHLVDGELFVDPNSQNKGIARALIRHTLLEAVTKYAPVHWDTYTFNEQSFPLDWYYRLGFKPINEWIMIRADVREVLAACSKK